MRVRWWLNQKEIDTFKRWEILVPESGPGTMNEKNQKSFRNIGDMNWLDLGVRYR